MKRAVWGLAHLAFAGLLASGANAELPARIEAPNLSACAAQLSPTRGGWCEMRQPGDEPSIAAHYPDVDKRTHMITGPNSVLHAWNSGALDEQRQKFYFMGGGHGDYGGNEVYEFDLAAGTWARLTDPSPLDFLYERSAARDGKPPYYCWTPDTRRVPNSTHTYDGLEYHPQRDTLLFFGGFPADGSCLPRSANIARDDPRILGTRNKDSPIVGFHEFNPDRHSARNGLPPLSWRRLEGPPAFFPRAAVLPDGSIVAGDKGTLRRYHFDGDRLVAGERLARLADYGDGTLIHDEGRDVFWSLHRRALLKLDASGKRELRVPSDFRHGKSPQLDRHGRLVAWSGFTAVHTLDPDAETPEWTTLDWGEHGPREGDSRVYGKWRYLTELDIFVGIATDETGVFAYRHPAP